MNIIIQSTLNTLQKSKSLLSILTDKQLSNNSISPYNSSIGSHIRHIFDFYDCALSIDESGCVDLTARKRISDIENCCDSALNYLNELSDRLSAMDLISENEVNVIDDLGLGKIKIKYTYASLLAQANSHTIHHYAIINYILDRLNISFEDSDFGYNPTTPKEVFKLD